MGIEQGGEERGRPWRCLQESLVEVVEAEVVRRSLGPGPDPSHFQRSPSGRGQRLQEQPLYATELKKHEALAATAIITLHRRQWPRLHRPPARPPCWPRLPGRGLRLTCWKGGVAMTLSQGQAGTGEGRLGFGDWASLVWALLLGGCAALGKFAPSERASEQLD